jgi:O-antigen/teichoic acid export membrane protein
VLFIGVSSAYLAVLWLFGGRLMGVLYAGKYTKFTHLLILVAAPVVITAASQGSVIAVQAMQFPVDIFIAYSAAALLTIVAGIPLTYYFGLVGAAVGTLISSFGMFVAVTYCYQVRLRSK